MIDYGARKTDLAVKRTEWRLSRVYRQAERDIAEKMEAWQKRHAAREKLYRQQLKDGKITQADFDAWMRGQVFQGKQWQARKEQIQAVLLNADKSAAKIVNDGKLGVFVDNANYIGYGLEHDANINTGFMLYDEQTVARLIKSDPQILPKPAPGVKKDKAYSYYNKLVNGAITQGIVQGEDIRQIAKRIAKVTGERSYSSAVRNARTAFTGAQNAGRIEGLHQAQRLGINVKKKWLATLDSRTRDSHRKLDGQIQEVDDPFISELGKIRFPGDPTANGGDVWNCRCTLTYVYPEYPSEMQRRDNETGEIVGDMTYEEWLNSKRGGTSKERPESKVIPFTDIIKAMKRAGDYSIDEYKTAGKAVYDEYTKRFTSEMKDKIVDYEQYSERVNELDNWFRTETKRILSENRDNRREGQRLINELRNHPNMSELTKIRTVVGKLNQELNKTHRKLLLETLNEMKEFGGFTKKDLLGTLLNNSRSSAAVDDIVEAVGMYPKGWTQHRIAAGKITVKRAASNARAHFDNILNELTTDGSLKTTIHEYGHSLEYAVPGLQKAADEFYKYRTKDCPLEKLRDVLGSGYSADEVTRRDKFRSVYMGKDYHSERDSFPTELLSMGYEELYGSQFTYDRKYYDKDTEMRDWLLGLLALVD